MSRRTGQVAQTQGNRQADSSSQYKAVVALSSAESELYAIRTGAQEGLHIANFIKEATTTKVNIRIHTDSTSGKSIATRIGSSKKAKHIDLKYLFIQQLVQNGILSIHKISTHDNPADILTKYVPAEVLNKHLYMAGIHCPQHHNGPPAEQCFTTTKQLSVASHGTLFPKEYGYNQLYVSLYHLQDLRFTMIYTMSSTIHH